MKRGLFALCVLVILVTGAALRPTEAADPLFAVDRTYAFIWDCTPEWMAQLASATVAGGAPLSPCYTERLKVRAVRKDGWLEVQDLSDNSIWTVNPARALAIREHVVPLQAAR